MNLFSGFSIRLVLSAIIVIVLLWIIFRFRKGKHASGSSLEILKERLEKGEISQKEYDQARKRQGK